MLIFLTLGAVIMFYLTLNKQPNDPSCLAHKVNYAKTI